MQKIGKRKRWTLESFRATQAAIKSDLEKREEAFGLSERHQYTIDRIKELQNRFDGEAPMECYILILNTLNGHLIERNILTTPQVNNLLKLANAILKLSAIKPKTSKLSFLHGELHFITSQIHSKQGDSIAAAFELQNVLHVSGATPPGGQAFQDLFFALHALKIGNLKVAQSKLLALQSENSDKFIKKRSLVLLLKSYRLLEDEENFLRTIDKLKDFQDNEAVQLEIAWETGCLEVKKTGNIRPLVQMIKKNHYKGTYALELFLWIRATSSNDWNKALPKLKSLAEALPSIRSYSHFYRVAFELDRVYDTEVPFNVRMSQIKNVTSDLHLLTDIDKVLLAQLAITRWLLHSNNHAMAGLLFFEYYHLSLKVSLGKDCDILGLAGDILKREWIQDMLNLHDPQSA